jgi:hypothetical protein
MRCSIPILVLSLASSSTIAEPNWAYVLDQQLNTTPIRIDESSTAQGVIGTDRNGMPIRFTPAQIRGLWIDQDMAFRDGIDADDYEHAMHVELTDGQRVIMLIEPSSDEELVQGKRLESHQLVSIPLERIRSIRRVSETRDFQSPVTLFDASIEDDAIRLSNEDTVLGFIISIGQNVLIETTSNGQTLTRNYPVDQIRAMMLQNPEEPGAGLYILTTLRERLRVSDYQWDEARGIVASLDDTIHTNSQSQSFNAELLGMELVTDSSILIDLQSYSPAIIQPSGDRAWAPDPKLSVSRWVGGNRTRARIESPISMTWNLPVGSSRMTMSVNAWNQQWTNNQVIISTTTTDGVTQTLWSKHYDATPTPDETLNLELPENAATLRFEIDPAENGPIQDKFFLQLPMVLIEQSTELQ